MNLPGYAPSIHNEKPADSLPTPRQNGALRLFTLDALDGRTAAAKQAQEMRRAIIRDLTGGDDETALTTLKLALVDAVCISTAIINDANVRWLRGEPVNLSEITTLSNARRRDAQLLGLERVMRDVTDLDAYLSGGA